MLLPTVAGLGASDIVTARSAPGQAPPPSTQIAGDKSNDQQSMVPTSIAKSSMTCNCQVPLTAAPDLPLKVDSGWSGRKAPKNGALPLSMSVVALSSNTVRELSGEHATPKSLPAKPLLAERVVRVPSGAISWM